MATYRPATVDDSAVLARMARDRRRAAEAASRPGKTQTYQTTGKVASAEATASSALSKAESAAMDASTALATATEAKTAAAAASSALSTYETATDARVSALESVAVLPVGSCVLMASETAPGLTGKWSLVTGVKLPMTGSDTIYYVYERTV